MKKIEIVITPDVKGSQVFISGKEVTGIYKIVIDGSINAGESMPEMTIELHGHRMDESGLVFQEIDGKKTVDKFIQKIRCYNLNLSADFNDYPINS